MLHKRKEMHVPGPPRWESGMPRTHEHVLAHEYYRKRQERQSSCRSKEIISCFVFIYLLGAFFVIIYSAIIMYIYESDENELMKFKLRTNLNPGTRTERFPSVDDRVKRYMSEWYLHPCGDNDKFTFSKVFNGNYTTVEVNVEERPYTFHGIIQKNVPLYVDTLILSDCTGSVINLLLKTFHLRASRSDTIEDRNRNKGVCADLEELQHLQPPLVLFGGVAPPVPIPMFCTSRSLTQKVESSTKSCRTKVLHKAIDYPPILWRLSSRKQFDIIAAARSRDTPWERKKLTAIHRELAPVVQTMRECHENPSCHFILQHANSKLIDAGYQQFYHNRAANTTFDGIPVFRASMGTRGMQSHKVIIDFGNGYLDHGAELAWKLYSNSVLLMPLPTQTTWLMEDLLQPWMHFIPLNDTNAEDMVKWVIDNDEEAHRISERATLFIYDLLLHPQAMIDEEKIKRQIIERYQAHWLSNVMY